MPAEFKAKTALEKPAQEKRMQWETFTAKMGQHQSIKQRLRLEPLQLKKNCMYGFSRCAVESIDVGIETENDESEASEAKPLEKPAFSRPHPISMTVTMMQINAFFNIFPPPLNVDQDLSGNHVTAGSVSVSMRNPMIHHCASREK